jgi:hypothetical protein
MTKREPDECHPKYERTGLNRFLRRDRAKPKRGLGFVLLEEALEVIEIREPAAAYATSRVTH